MHGLDNSLSQKLASEMSCPSKTGIVLDSLTVFIFLVFLCYMLRLSRFLGSMCTIEGVCSHRKEITTLVWPRIKIFFVLLLFVCL